MSMVDNMTRLGSDKKCGWPCNEAAGLFIKKNIFWLQLLQLNVVVDEQKSVMK